MKNLVKAVILMVVIAGLFPSLSDAECISIRKAQSILKELNYFPDEVDGVMGTATVNSIRTFQADYELKTTGDLDKATCAALMAEEERMVKERQRQKQELMTKRAQLRLRELGYYDGPVNGKRSDIPEDVVKEFQSQHGLEPSGRLNGVTFKMLFSDEAHAKTVPEDIKAPVVERGPEPVAPPGKAEPAPVKSVEKPSSGKPPLWNWSVGSMTYEPKSLYDSTSYEAHNETLNPEQAVVYKSESYLVNRLTLTLTNHQFYLGTSRLTGGDNAADSLGFLWWFETRKIPLLLVLDYSQIESEARYALKMNDITTRSFDSELLLRHMPGLNWGVNLTYDTYPTLVSAKSKNDQYRSIRFDEDFTLATLNLAFHYDTVAAGKTGLFRSDVFFPYMNVGVFGGMSYGRVSGGVIDALSTDLSHSFDDTVYNINLAVNPEIGVKYIFKRRKYDLEMTLGYGLNVNWPAWKLPENGDDEQIDFYRRNLSHGLVFGINAVF